ncbi:Hypothetical protein I596_2264 [Dokdonella koreensis DS-123]|uniref:Uncharacterized protein n=1 Tax=Dokdonella koreensis DS-123 TaxID=1300342 RepID=A0A160DUV0_9GAMM|nr:Hypothetical protein I596_2264 [Dokdonella koreensis DS-123]
MYVRRRARAHVIHRLSRVGDRKEWTAVRPSSDGPARPHARPAPGTDDRP